MSESQIITDEKLTNIHPGEILKSWKKNHALKFESIKMYAYVQAPNTVFKVAKNFVMAE